MGLGVGPVHAGSTAEPVRPISIYSLYWFFHSFLQNISLSSLEKATSSLSSLILAGGTDGGRRWPGAAAGRHRRRRRR